jgi:hypothetical protein
MIGIGVWTVVRCGSGADGPNSSPGSRLPRGLAPFRSGASVNHWVSNRRQDSEIDPSHIRRVLRELGEFPYRAGVPLTPTRPEHRCPRGPHYSHAKIGAKAAGCLRFTVEKTALADTKATPASPEAGGRRPMDEETMRELVVLVVVALVVTMVVVTMVVVTMVVTVVVALVVSGG